MDDGDSLLFSRDQFLPTITFTFIDQDSAFLHIYTRITSWDMEGERTDVNDIYSTLLALWLRARLGAYGAELWDVHNPATDIPGELYARVITLDQPEGSKFNSQSSSMAELRALFEDMASFRQVFSRIFTWDQLSDQKYAHRGLDKDVNAWGEAVSKSFGLRKVEEPIVARRWAPDWGYYRDVSARISVVYSPRLAAAVHTIFNGPEGYWTSFRGVKSEVFTCPRVHQAVASRAAAYLRRSLVRLEGQPPLRFCALPLENRIVAAARMHTVFLSHRSGIFEFRRERARIRARQARENRELFPAARFQWENHIDDERFEQLVQALINREPGIGWARKSGHSRDADGGKDLIAEWAMSSENRTLGESESPVVVRTVLVQVKASARGVGKGDVKDIRDTVEHHRANGFLLVVASHVTSDLADHLRAMREQGRIWVDWWTRAELEDRLNAYPDVAARFPDVVRRLVQESDPTPQL